jgi:hypothetical protein
MVDGLLVAVFVYDDMVTIPYEFVHTDVRSSCSWADGRKHLQMYPLRHSSVMAVCAIAG